MPDPQRSENGTTGNTRKRDPTKCKRCHVRDPKPGRVNCQRCISYTVAKNHAARMRRNEAGLCQLPGCGQPIATDKKSVFCVGCRQKNRDNNNKRLVQIKLARARKAGLIKSPTQGVKQ